MSNQDKINKTNRKIKITRKKHSIKSLSEYETYCDDIDIDELMIDKVSVDDEISSFLSKIHNKYSNNAEQKHLNQVYDIGILCVNKSFDHQKLVSKLTRIIDERSQDPLKNVREHKKATLIAAFKKGIEDGMSDDYRLAYDSSNKYQYDSEKLKKRAHIDRVLNHF